MVDHQDQLPLVASLTAESTHRPLVFVKIDMGYHRAGVEPETAACASLLRKLAEAHARGECVLHGLYAHAGQSYNTRGDFAALPLLAAEFAALETAAATVFPSSSDGLPPLVLSVGATPTATTLQHPALAAGKEHDDDPAAVADLAALLGRLARRHPLEVHAGVYPVLDLQQLATRAAAAPASAMAMTVLAEVASLYPDRGEALINAGSLALGREPVAASSPDSYSAWGIVAPWGVCGDEGAGGVAPGPEFPRLHGGWQGGRISQEHGVLTWKGESGSTVPELAVGQRVRVWPNHACIAGAGHDYYLIVDSRRRGNEDDVVDVWVRWRGW